MITTVQHTRQLTHESHDTTQKAYSTCNTLFVVLTIPLGPSVLLTKSPIATAPIKEDYRTTQAHNNAIQNILH